MIYSLRGAPGDSCLIADSPHSGRDYPADFRYACSLPELRQAEDALVDRLYDFLPGMGVPLLAAEFPRSYLDPNRPSDLSGCYPDKPDSPYPLSNESQVRKETTPWSGISIYDRPVTLGEVFRRAALGRLYHGALDWLVEETHARQGKAVLADLHSMLPRVGKKGVPNAYDILIGTNGGRAAAPELSGALVAAFSGLGYRTGLDVRDFLGGEIVRRHGRPHEGRHALLIEVNRGLYLDEKTLDPSAGFAALQKDLRAVMGRFKVFCAALTPK